MIAEIMSNVVKNVSEQVGYDVKYLFGSTLSVVNQITLLQRQQDVYPAIILFQEGLTETKYPYYTEANIQKMAICTLTKYDLTDMQRIHTTFKDVIYPCYDAFLSELQKIHSGYELIINRADIQFFNESGNKHTFNQMVDGCVLRPFTMKIENKVLCKKL